MIIAAQYLAMTRDAFIILAIVLYITLGPSDPRS